MPEQVDKIMMQRDKSAADAEDGLCLYTVDVPLSMCMVQHGTESAKWSRNMQKKCSY